MMRLAPGVRVFGISTPILLAIVVAQDLWHEHGADELVVTSVTEGQHKRGSFHYAGNAVDLRVRNLPEPKWDAVRQALASRLGPDYDVILETDPPHLHLEFDPKEAY